MTYGIMQSRLSPIDLSRGYQYWPEMWWDNEFKLAKLYGFDHIEWIYDENSSNLLNTDLGVKEILEKIKQTGVNVDCICADYFIKHPFWVGHIGIKVLNKLIVQGFKLGARNIVLPLIEESSIFENQDKLEGFINNMRLCLDTAGRYMINICLETDLSPDNLKCLIEPFKSERLGICHDTGNVECQGYDAVEAFHTYHALVKHIHLKDKCKGQQSNIEINTGHVNFKGLFALMSVLEYDGTVTLQCARKEYDLDFIKRQYKKVRQLEGK